MDKILYSLGVYLGEYIVDHYLPTLSCSMIRSKNVIQTTWGEAQHLRKLDDAWYNKLNEEQRKLRKQFPDEKTWKLDNKAQELVKDKWNESIKYLHILEKKYLPHTLECYNIPVIDFSNEKHNKIIKKGVKDALWDCDMCSYSTKEEDIIFEEEKIGKYKHSIVKLKLDLNPPKSYTGNDWNI